jgi:hypothetical protein
MCIVDGRFKCVVHNENCLHQHTDKLTFKLPKQCNKIGPKKEYKKNNCPLRNCSSKGLHFSNEVNSHLTPGLSIVMHLYSPNLKFIASNFSTLPYLKDLSL